MRTLYPPVEPFSSFMLPVSSLHSIYVEQVGNPKGIPIVFLHGGPGGGIDADYRRFFNPDRFHVVLFDQRGSGKSTPYACLKENTTWELVADIERIRKRLNIPKWHVFGGSWGSTLSLAYAIKHPDMVSSLILRGIFLLRQKELSWFYQYGASEIFPDMWEGFLKPIPEEERGDLVTAYAKRLFSDNPATVREASRAWSIWEGSTSRLFPDSNSIKRFESETFAKAFALIECHYFVNKGFFPYDGWLLDNVKAIQDIPGLIVQGRYDVVCPADSAWQLHKAWRKSQLQIIPDAGHSAAEKSITSALIEATEAMTLLY